MYTIGSKIIAHLQKVDDVTKGRFVYPVSCEIDASNYCQLNCKWCIYKDYLKSNRVHLDFGTYVYFLEQLKLYQCKSITFTGGGEPLLNPKIREMIRVAYNMNFELGLITNGINLGVISEYYDYFKFIRVSLDAISAEMYEEKKGADYFDLVCDNISKVVKESETDVGISMVYEEGGCKLIDSFYDLGKRLNVSYVQAKPVISNDVESLSKEMEGSNEECFITGRYRVTDDLPCKIAGLIGQVAADGKYYYCCVHRGEDDFCVGDLKRNVLIQIIKRRMKFKPDLSKCSTCRYMNYANEYKKVRGSKYRLLRHVNHL